jgi:hypothetical protein
MEASALRNANIDLFLFGIHRVSIAVVIGDSFPEVKQSGHDADHSPPSIAQVKIA